MMHQIKEGFALATKSFALLKRYSFLLLYTLIPTLITIVIDMGLYYFNSQESQSPLLSGVSKLLYNIKTVPQWSLYFDVFIIFLETLVAVFCLAALVYHVMQIYNRNAISMTDSFRTIFHKGKTLTLWAIIGTAETFLIQRLALLGNTSSFSTLIPVLFFSFLIAAAWAFITFLVIPIITFQNLSVTQAICQSAIIVQNRFYVVLGCFIGIAAIIFMCYGIVALLCSIIQNYTLLFLCALLDIFARSIVAATYGVLKTTMYRNYQQPDWLHVAQHSFE